ncbi:MAG TPA: TOBE domain-containing protein [Nitrososphaerales archaeon]|nr:TOBE domain-containing protein [Nitrososphaerales archaeon]
MPAKAKKEMALRPGLWLYLEDGSNKLVLDQVDARILRFVGEKKSITESARAVSISYRNAWDRIRGMERRLGFKVVVTQVGGPSGGSAELTEKASLLLSDFRSLRKQLFNLMEDEAIPRRRKEHGTSLTARVVGVEYKRKFARVRLALPKDSVVEVSVSKDATEGRPIRAGDQVRVLIRPEPSLRA